MDLASGTAQAEASAKSMLALTATGSDPVSTAKASWNALLAILGEGMPTARSFTRDDLPESLREVHSCIDPSIHDALTSLKQHSSTIMDTVDVKLGPIFHLERPSLVSEVTRALSSVGVALITGHSGAGKS